MKGKVLGFSFPEGTGAIVGDDGNRYSFASVEWKSDPPPFPGSRVDFETGDQVARAIYLDVPARRASGPVDGGDWADLYRSSDEKMIGGVCAGLAHKWNVGVAGVRAVALLSLFFFGLPLIAYLVCWIVFPLRPTKNPV